MKLPVIALTSALRARGLNTTILARRAGVPKAILDDALENQGELGDEQIRAIADELAIPIQALFSRKALPLLPAVDFRTIHSDVGEFAKGVLQTINFVERLSTTLAAAGLDVSLDPSVTRYATTSFASGEAQELAAVWRERWGLDDLEQLRWHDANKVYSSLRTFIEGLGILVLHRQFRTDEAAGLYAHVDGGPHVIAINTTHSSKARKLFTLAHEFAHVLIRAEGASNPSILKNRIERFCNTFAASLLAPKHLITTALERSGYQPSADDDNFIRLFSSKLGISQEATYLRLVEFGYLRRSDYNAWKSNFDSTNQIPTGDMSNGGGGGTSDPIRNKQTQFGMALLKLLENARRGGKLDEVDIFRLCGLKPHFQNRLFGAA